MAHTAAYHRSKGDVAVVIGMVCLMMSDPPSFKENVPQTAAGLLILLEAIRQKWLYLEAKGTVESLRRRDIVPKSNENESYTGDSV